MVATSTGLVLNSATEPEVNPYYAWTAYFPWKLAIFLFWCLGVIYLFVKHLGGELCVWRQSKSWIRVDDPEILKILESARQEVGIRREIPCFLVPMNLGAALVGTFSPKILLSESVLQKITHEELRFVFLHELTHLKRLDPLIHRLVIYLSMVHWPNPALWFARGMLEHERELACDAAVLHALKSEQNQEYGQMVLAFAEMFVKPKRKSAVVGILQNYGLKRRINMIARNRPAKLRYTILGVMLLALVFISGLTRAVPFRTALISLGGEGYYYFYCMN